MNRGLTDDQRRQRCRRQSTLAFLFLALGWLFPVASAADVLDDLRQELFEKREVVQKIEERIKKTQTDLAQKRKEANTLKTQIAVIDTNVQGLTLQIDKTTAEIAEVEAEIAAIREEIRLAETDIERQKLLLREYLRTLQALDADSIVEAILKYPTLSQSLVEVRAIYRAEQHSQGTLDRIQELRVGLKERAEAFTDLQRELDTLLSRQTNQKQTLEDQQVAKERLLEVTKAQEAEFNKLLAAAVAARKQANAEIARLDAAIREELERRGITRLGGVGVFDWPIDPIFGISCGFRCPDYPYRSLIGEHTGIDMPTHMGTPIRAGADGYVGRVSIAGGAGYSYILLIHGDNLSTVYGHIASASVKEDSFVTRGQVIGATGGAPGTPGAGLSTGPHLHFEVRKNGIPVNPAGYLP